MVPADQGREQADRGLPSTKRSGGTWGFPGTSARLWIVCKGMKAQVVDEPAVD